MKGLAHVAGIEALEAQGCKFQRVAGTSAGAIAGTLYALGYTPETMRSSILDKNLLEFLEGYQIDGFKRLLGGDTSLSSILKAARGVLGQASNGVASQLSPQGSGMWTSVQATGNDLLKRVMPFYGKAGLSSGDNFRHWIEGLMSAKLSRDLENNPDAKKILARVDKPEHDNFYYLTFGELHQLIQKGLSYRELAVVVTRITEPYASITLRSDIMTSDWRDVIISDAVRASMSLPGVFSAHQLYKKLGGERGVFGNDRYVYYADGGLLKNIAFDAFDCAGFQRYFYTSVRGDEAYYSINPQTIALGLASASAIQAARDMAQDENLPSIKEVMVRTAAVAWDSETTLMQKTDTERLIVLNTGDIDTYDFDAGQDAIKTLMQALGQTVNDVFDGIVDALIQTAAAKMEQGIALKRDVAGEINNKKTIQPKGMTEPQQQAWIEMEQETNKNKQKIKELIRQTKILFESMSHEDKAIYFNEHQEFNDNALRSLLGVDNK